ncbi:MAG: sodium-dependent transporter [Tannerella sp.]|jgi:NSS family neurotransmitter:Na+ symporter|nr:sodium-dependent transporter [Tannerella sp.]
MADTVQNRDTFGSRLGVIFATVGCAVGLGNVWRFPYMLGTNGGAAFLLVYFLCALLLGLPVMMAEFYIGRYSRRNAVGAFNVIAPKTRWRFVGYNGVLAAFLILGFYFVISGWTFEYVFQSIAGSFEGKSTGDIEAEFTAFSSSIFRPVFWTLLFIFITHFIIVTGVKNGIERSSKLLMPLLFVILVVLCIRSVTLPGAMAGLEFLFRPDFSKINSQVLLSAMGQAFFSLSVGMGCLITYSSYFGKETKLPRTALEVTVIDTLVAVLAGIMIFPAVFSFGIEPAAGVELVFITLPNVFGQLPLGNLWACIFFLLLAVAALTSTISLHEVATAFLHEERGITRKRAALLVSLGVTALAVLSSLSFGIMKDFTIFGLTFFDFLDYVTAKLMLPLGGMFICIFVGWRIDRKILKAELTNGGTVAFYFFSIYSFLLKYIAPLAIGFIFLNELALIDFIREIF